MNYIKSINANESDKELKMKIKPITRIKEKKKKKTLIRWISMENNNRQNKTIQS
jgi:hypothetical protein